MSVNVITTACFGMACDESIDDIYDAYIREMAKN